MSNTEDRKKAGNPRARTLRLVLLLLVLVCVLFWDRERRARLEFEEFADFIVVPLTPEQLAQIEANQRARQRSHDAFYLMVEAEEAEEEKDMEEALRLIAKLIDTYQNDEPAADVHRFVCWALHSKGDYTDDVQAKIRLYETVVERYCDAGDSDRNIHVMGSVWSRLQLAESDAEKAAFCENTLEKYESRLTDRLATYLLDKKADLTRNREARIAVYDVMLNRFLSSPNVAALRRTVAAAMSKAKLTDDEAEQLRLCDIVIDAFLKAPHTVRHSDFRDALHRKAERIGDPSLPLTLWNRIIEDNLFEDAVAQARIERLPLLKDDAERLAACDALIKAHRSSNSEHVVLAVARALLHKARLLADPAEKAGALHSVFEKCAGVSGSLAHTVVLDAAALLAGIDPAAAIRHHDELAAMPEEQRKAILALEEEIRDVAGEREKIRLYDSILYDRKDIPGRYFFPRLFRERLALTADDAEQLELIDRYTEVHEDSMDPDIRMLLLWDEIVGAHNLGFTDYAWRCFDDVVGFCEEYLNSGENGYGASPAKDAERISVMDSLGRAILAKARYSMSTGARASDEEILALCEKYLAYPQPEPELPRYMNYIREKILAKKAELLGKNSRTPLDQI